MNNSQNFFPSRCFIWQIFFILGFSTGFQAFAQCPADPGCLAIIDSEEYLQIINDDPFCCQNAWDNFCQANYFALGGQVNTSPECGGVSDCTVDPGCAAILNSAAYLIVVDNDPFCCSFEWDALCDLAYTNEGGLPNPSPECAPDCLDLDANFGDSCDDSNPFTYNDEIQPDCSCSGASAQENDSPCSAIPVDCNSSLSGFTFGASPDQVGICGTNDGTGGGVWYSISPATASVITVSTCENNNYDTKVRVFQGNCSAPICVGGNDDFCGLQSQVSFTASASQVYYILVHGYEDFEGNFNLSIACTPIFECPNLMANIGDACTAQGLPGSVSEDCTCIPEITCNVVGGTLATSSPRLNLCVGDGDSDLIQLTITGNSGIGRFGLVRQSDLSIIATTGNGNFNMENYPPGTYFVGHVSMNSLADLSGINNVNDLAGCYDLSNQLLVTSYPISGGTITTTDATTICGGNVAVSVTGNQGPNSKFVLLNQNATEVIIQNSTGVFNFNNRPPGQYRIVHLAHANGVNLAAIVPPALPACTDASNTIQVNREACGSARIEAWPNPSSGESNIRMSTADDTHALIELYDITGRNIDIVFNQKVFRDQEYLFDVNISSLPNGTYVYKLTTESEVLISKFLLAR